MLTINECYKNFVNEVLSNGRESYKDNDDHILEKLGNYYHIEDPLGLKYKAKYMNMTPFKMAEMIKSGEFDIEGSPIKKDALYKYVISVYDKSDNGFAYTYPNRILEHFGVDQKFVMLNRLLDNVGSNRAVAVTYDPKADCLSEDIPCLQTLQAIVRDNELSMHCFFRSNDIYGAFYSNMYFVTFFGLMLRDLFNDELRGRNVGFGGVHYYSSSAHIYWNDLKAAKRLVRRA